MELYGYRLFSHVFQGECQELDHMTDLVIHDTEGGYLETLFRAHCARFTPVLN
jgi:hypothetical protein